MPDRSSVVVQIWPLAVSERRLEALSAYLSPDEREKAERIRAPVIARDFVAVRGTVREQLAIECGCEPGDLKFAAGPQGKPHLISPSLPVTFNLSHSGGYCALATARAARLGVDIEMIRPTVGDLAESVFTHRETVEYAATAKADRMRAFFRAWVAKEAYLKATGEGLGGGLRSLELNLTTERDIRPISIRGSETEPAKWQFRGFDVLDTIVGAVVVDAGGNAVEFDVRFAGGEAAR